MSLSINSPSVKVDTFALDRPLAAPKQDSLPAAVNLGHVPLPQHGSPSAQGGVVFNTGAFAKLFEMFEMVLKAMRDMLSGKGMTVDAGHPPKLKPQAADMAKVIPDPGKSPKVTPATPDLPKVAAKVFPSVPKPDVNVTNDAASQVKVEVTINHCHCPDDNAEHAKGVRPKVMPVLKVPGAEHTALVVPPPVLPIAPKPSEVHKPETTPRAEPDLTSPGPAEPRLDRRHWRLNTLNTFKS